MADIEEGKVVESKRGKKRKAKTESRKQHEVCIICFTIWAKLQNTGPLLTMHQTSRLVWLVCSLLFALFADEDNSGRYMSIISIVDKSRSLSIKFDTNQSTNIGCR